MNVEVKLYTPMTIQLVTEDEEYISQMREEFTKFVPGFMYMPAYRAGRWNGRVCMINKFDNSLPYGLLFDLIRIHKKRFPRNRLVIDQEVSSLFKGTRFRVKQNLKYKPRPYQKDCINAALRYKKGIIRSATASGKSLVIAYIAKTLLEKKNSGVNKVLIIVPSKQLVEQFYKDMIDYGIKQNMLGRVYQKYKHWNKPIVIATWQTLSRNHEQLLNYEAIIKDEVHGSKAYELKQILSKATRSHYRLGFTGTLHSDELDNWNTKAYLGPVLREYPSGFLADKGYISKCNVKMINIEYQQENWEGAYNDVKDEVFINDYRTKLICKLVNSLDHNVLLLVGKVEKEGEYLERVLKELTDKEVVFLSGRDDVEVREDWREKFKNRSNIALIATFGIFQLGINLPNLKYLILAAPFKSKIRILQSIGRTLRKHSNKKDGSVIFDIHDDVKYFQKYGDIRARYYDQEGFGIEDFVFVEGDEIDLDTLHIQNHFL